MKKSKKLVFKLKKQKTRSRTKNKYPKPTEVIDKW